MCSLIDLKKRIMLVMNRNISMKINRSISKRKGVLV